MRPPPEGALYHRAREPALRRGARARARRREARSCSCPAPPSRQRATRGRASSIPERPVDGTALLATVDLTIGAGGTMTRESALLGTPTYTVFLARARRGRRRADPAGADRRPPRVRGRSRPWSRRRKPTGAAERRSRRGDPRRRAAHGRRRGAERQAATYDPGERIGHRPGRRATS